MTARVTISARPSRLTVGISQRGYLLLGATAGALGLSLLSTSGIILALGGALGLFCLGEFYTVTLHLRELTKNTAIQVTPTSRESHSESRSGVTVAVASEPPDEVDIFLTAHTETSSDTSTEPLRTERWIPTAPEDDRINLTLTGRVDSPEGVCTAELAVVDTEMPLEELDSGEAVSGSAEGTRPDQHVTDSNPSVAGDEYDGLREYVAGDPFSDVDWKTTARQGTLHVREWAHDSTKEQAVVLDLLSLPTSAWQAGVNVCRDHCRRQSESRRISIGVIRPSGEVAVNTTYAHQSLDTAVEYIEQTIEDVSESGETAATMDIHDGVPPQIQRRTQIGTTVAKFRRNAAIQRNSVETALRQIRRHCGGSPSVSLVTGSRTTARTSIGINSAADGGPVEVHLLSPPGQGSATETLEAGVDTESDVSVIERPLQQRGVDRESSHRTPEYALTRQVEDPQS